MSGSVQLNQHFELVIRFDYDEEAKQAVKALERRTWNAKEKAWVAPPTPKNIAMILEIAEQFGWQVADEIHSDAAEWLVYQHELARQAASRATTSNLKQPTELNGKLRPFQLAGVDYARQAKRCLIADEMGLGKTVQALAVLALDKVFPALVVCPKPLKLTWQMEIERWLPRRSLQLINAGDDLAGADLTVIHYNILSRYANSLREYGFKGVIFDEAHALKNHTTQMTKAAQKMVNGKGFYYRLLLTGTPLLNRPKELIAPLKIMGRLNDLGGFDYFADRYCNARRSRAGTILEMDGAAYTLELNERLRATCYIRRTKAEVLPELPPKQQVVQPMRLNNLTEYRRAERWLAIENEEHAPESAIQQIERLQQLAAKGKLEAILDWIANFLETEGEKLVVFAHHLEIIHAIAVQFNAPALTGAMPDAERARVMARFQSDPDMRLLVAGFKVGGVGLTLHAASHVAFAELRWTPAEMDQAEDRLHRIGQRSAVTAWYLYAPGTIEEDMYHILAEKRATIEQVTEGRAALEVLRRARQRVQADIGRRQDRRQRI